MSDLPLRRWLAALLTLGLAGTSAELWLLGHDEEWRQVVPFAVSALSLLSLAATLVRPSPGPVSCHESVTVTRPVARSRRLSRHQCATSSRGYAAARSSRSAAPASSCAAVTSRAANPAPGACGVPRISGTLCQVLCIVQIA